MKYLLIGGCGFIGTNFAEQLLLRNDSVILADNLSRRGTTENLEYLKSKYSTVTFAHLDIRTDTVKISQLVEDVDVVYHLAGQVAVTTSIRNPREDFEINLLGTLNILEAIRNSTKKPILMYASTNKVYGGMEEIAIEEKNNKYQYRDFPLGIRETQLLDFHSPYGCSKGGADQYVRDYSRIYDLQTVVMRQSCIYGTRQFGIEDQGWVAWFTIASILGRDITVYGDGKQVRDVLFVDDLFAAWDIATKKIKTTSGKIYNVGGGAANTLSLLELLELLESELGKKVPHTFGDWRAGDQPVYISDISLLQETTGWKPTHTVKVGVQKLANWVKENSELLKTTLDF